MRGWNEMGKELMSQKTDSRALLKQRLPVFFIGLGITAFIMAAAIADFLLDDYIFSANIPVHMLILVAVAGVVLMILPFVGILHFELVVYEEGFSYVSGKTEAIHRFTEIAEIGYGVVTYRGKPNGMERIYVVLETNARDVFLPSIDRQSEDGWAEISQALADAYVKSTGHDIVDGERHIPV